MVSENGKKIIAEAIRLGKECFAEGYRQAEAKYQEEIILIHKATEYAYRQGYCAGKESGLYQKGFDDGYNLAMSEYEKGENKWYL